MQSFKSVYFSDHPGSSPRQRSLKLAFGPADADLFSRVQGLGSEDIRRLLGCQTYHDLKAHAARDGRSVNAYGLARLRRTVAQTPPPSLFPSSGRSPFNPIQATFRGGIKEPLHSWYPYLEGYSPEFVKTILRDFAPGATTVLDPFAGTGTTPLTSATTGCRALYCEINPLLQLLIDTKSRFLAMPVKDRLRTVDRLRAAADELTSRLPGLRPDKQLEGAYTSSFGNSQFFTPETYDSCLRLRRWLDLVAGADPQVGAAATVASVAALVPCSRMIRRGDLRFRRPTETERPARGLVAEVRRRLHHIAEDLAHLPSPCRAPTLVVADAKRLHRVPALETDAIVTSPPYLNGTNYYRNTKIELWFLRVLRSGDDLTTLRRHTVTAGINDVTSSRVPVSASPEVDRLVLNLEETAYDRRIPLMVSHYFADMASVFRGLAAHAKPSSPLLMDIGDSSYSNVRVDTPSLLAELLRAAGWRIRDEVLLRRRKSRNGQVLRQVLVVAAAPSRRCAPRRSRAKWRPLWTRFKSDLPHQRGRFAKRNWGGPLHSLCSYQGKLKPSLAHHLVGVFTTPGDRVLDPFGGVGTIAFEAALRGCAAWTFDISPVAAPVASAKLRPATATGCNDILGELDRYLRAHRATRAEHRAAREIAFNGPLPSFYHPRTFNEILLARRFFRDHPPLSAAGTLVFASLLHILHGNRPYALSRRSHPITPFAPSGPFTDKRLVEKLSEKVKRSVSAVRPDTFVEGSSLLQDALAHWPEAIDDLDAVITSPPFYDSTRFYLANWIRLWFAGWSKADFRDRPQAFVDERQKQGLDLYDSVLRQSRERLKPGGVCVLHLGKSRKCDMASEIRRLARPWFKRQEIVAESVTHCESHGIRDKGSVAQHTYLVLS